MEQQVITKKIKSGIHRQGDSHAEPQDMQGGEGLIHQYFIDNNLKKNRGNQGDGIDKQDSQGDVQEGYFLPQDLGDEPAQTERLGFVAEFIRPFEEKDFTAPKSFELLTGQAQMAAAAPRQRIIAADHGFLLQVSLSGGNADQDDVSAIAQFCYCWISFLQVEKPIPLQFQQVGLETQVLGDAQEFDRRDFVKAQIILMEEAISG